MSFRERYREQRTPVWVGVRLDGIAVWIRLRDGGVHFGVKLDRDRIHYGGEKHTEYVLAIFWRRNRKGRPGKPHVLAFKVLAA